MNMSALVGILAFIIGGMYTIQAYLLPLASIGNPVAPKIFPMALGLIMTFLGLIMSIQEIKKGGLINNPSAKMDDTNKLIGYTCLTCILYALLFNRTGFVISTIIFLEIMLTLFNGKKNWKTNTIVAVSFSLIIYIAFSKFLGITLPVMPFIYI